MLNICTERQVKYFSGIYIQESERQSFPLGPKMIEMVPEPRGDSLKL